MGVDNVSNPSNTVVYYRMVTSVASSKEYGSQTFAGLQWKPRAVGLQDIYLGGYCDLFSNS